MSVRHFFAGERLCFRCLVGDPTEGCDRCGGASPDWPASERVWRSLAALPPNALAEVEDCARLVAARERVPLRGVVWSVPRDPRRMVSPCASYSVEVRLHAAGLMLSAHCRGWVEVVAREVTT